MAIYAVLTGDIVKSRQVVSKKELIKTLTEALDIVKEKYQADYILYRGDSFQVVIPSASDAAIAAIIIRSKLISCSPQKKERWDARIAIGLGSISYWGAGITDSDGPAFHLSGKASDDLNHNKNRLLIKSPWLQTEKILSLNTRFADDIISRWSRYSAETAYYNLVYNESQSLLAKRLNKSQPTINSRIATAKLDLITAYIHHVTEYIKWEIDNDHN